MTSIDNVTDVSPRVQYTALAAQVDFDYAFPIFDDADLVIDVDGVTKTLTTDYTVAGEGNDTGGTVTFVTAPGAGAVVTIYRDIAIERSTDIQQNGPLSSTTWNDEQDKVFLILQELENKIGRAIRFPLTGAITNAQAELSPISNFAGKFLRVTSAGLLEAAEALDNTVSLTAEVIGALLNPQTAAEVTAGVTPTAYRYVAGDLRRYGLSGSGDETAKLLNAIAACAEGGYTLKGEPGKTYTITTSSAIDLSGVLNVDMRGCTLDCSASTSTILFDINGTKEIAVSGQTITNGDGIIDVTGSGLTFARGDVILITSLEDHPNKARTTYFKGTRTYVDSQSGNDLRIYPQADFDYPSSSAYVWKVTENKINWNGGKIIGNAAVNQAGIVATLCDADLNVDIDYCAQAGVRFESSRGSYKGVMRYCYLGSSGTSYCVAISDLSEVTIDEASLTGSRHAVSIGGGGTWLQTDSGGSSGQAAYPSTVTINGGTYGASRSGTSFPSDPSLEIGAIDCHGIAKSLTVNGAVIHGGLQLAAIESCIVDSCQIYHRNYKIVGIADSVSSSWGHIQLTNNHCFFTGAFGPGETPAATPSFINAGATELGKRLTVRGNTLHADNATINATASLGLIRGFDYIDFADNKLVMTKSATSIAVTLEIWVTKHLNLRDNRLENCDILLRPIGQVAVVNAKDNEVEAAGLSGLRFITNPLDATAFFREMHFNNNLARNCYNCGIQGRGDVVERLYLEGNTAVNCNVSGNATDYTNSGIGIQKIDNNDIIELLVAKGNTAVSDSDATNAHDNGLYFATSATTNTDIILRDNDSVGHTTLAISDPEVAGNTVLAMTGNIGLPDQIEATNGSLYEYDGTNWGAA